MVLLDLNQPTILDLMGEKIPAHLQGKSLKPAMDGKADIGSSAVVEWNNREGPGIPSGIQDEVTAATRDPTRTIVTADGWRFTCSTLGRHELYNLNEDPMEIDNLALSGGYEALMSSLLEAIRDWQRRSGDRVQLPSSSLRIH